MARVLQQTWRVLRPGISRLCSTKPPSNGVSRRQYSWGLGPGRIHPFGRHRFFADDIVNDVKRQVKWNLRNMENLMDNFLPARCFPESVNVASRDMKIYQTDKLFEVRLNVSQFSPEELTVRQSGSRLIITGSHKQESEGQSLSREFTREITLPEHVEQDSLESVFTGSGQLILRGKVKDSPPENPDTVIKIQRTDPKPDGS
nr:small heat shock protein [Arenicola marina]